MTLGSHSTSLIAKKQTGNTLPDYVCTIVLYLHTFYADLKETNMVFFQKKVNKMFFGKNAIISTNIYWVKGVDDNFFF